MNKNTKKHGKIKISYWTDFNCIWMLACMQNTSTMSSFTMQMQQQHIQTHTNRLIAKRLMNNCWFTLQPSIAFVCIVNHLSACFIYLPVLLIFHMIFYCFKFFFSFSSISMNWNRETNTTHHDVTRTHWEQRKKRHNWETLERPSRVLKLNAQQNDGWMDRQWD